jgi:S1-C subfamily serine protease
LTNSVAVNGADKVTVTLVNSWEFEGKVRGVDGNLLTDLAIVKIEGNDLPVATGTFRLMCRVRGIGSQWESPRGHG